MSVAEQQRRRRAKSDQAGATPAGHSFFNSELGAGNSELFGCNSECGVRNFSDAIRSSEFKTAGRMAEFRIPLGFDSAFRVPNSELRVKHPDQSSSSSSFDLDNAKDSKRSIVLGASINDSVPFTSTALSISEKLNLD